MRKIKKLISFLLWAIKNRQKVKFCWDDDIANSFFEGKNSVASGTVIYNTYVGQATYIGRNSYLHSTKIGKFCSIADHVCVCLGNHPTDFVTMHPAFYYDTTKQIGYTFHKGSPIYDGMYKYPQGEDKYQILIGNDVWIGSHVLILGGVKIGNGAVIAAGAVVTKDIEPYSIVGGCPAKKIKMRFSEDIIDIINTSNWWNRAIEDIEKNYLYYTSVDKFKEL